MDSSASTLSFSTHFLDTEKTYSVIPEVHDGLDFVIPAGAHANRTVCMEANERKSWFELWSPNCNIHEFYPGRFIDEPLPAQTLSVNSRHSYADGRLGPGDWSLHPQHFFPHRPWLGFCRRSLHLIHRWRDVDAELVPLPLVWISSTSLPGKGRLYAPFIESLNTRARFLGSSVTNFRYSGQQVDTEELVEVMRNRPVFPQPNHLVTISNPDQYWEWDELVPLFTAVQRGLREMEAFLIMMRFWECRKRTGATDSIQPTALKYGDRIGCWLNGATEHEARWLLLISFIPLFVIHTYIPDVDFPTTNTSVLDRRPPPSRCYPNFVKGTNADILNSVQNLYLKVFHEAPSARVLPFHHDQILFQKRAFCSLSEKLRSAPWAARDSHQSHPSSSRPNPTQELDQAGRIARRMPDTCLLPNRRCGAEVSDLGTDYEDNGQFKIAHEERVADPAAITNIRAGKAAFPEASAASDHPDPAADHRVFNHPLPSVSPYLYVACNHTNSADIGNYITSICNTRHIVSGLRSIHRDPLAVLDSPYPGFVLHFNTTIECTVVRKIMNEDTTNVRMVHCITDHDASVVVLASSDSWHAAPWGTTPYAAQARNTSSKHDKTPSLLAPGPSATQSMATTGTFSSGNDNTSAVPAPSTSNTSKTTPPPSPPRAAKRTKRGGLRDALFRRFNKPFWEIVQNITPEELETCSPAEVVFMMRKRAERDVKLAKAK